MSARVTLVGSIFSDLCIFYGRLLLNICFYLKDMFLETKCAFLKSNMHFANRVIIIFFLFIFHIIKLSFYKINNFPTKNLCFVLWILYNKYNFFFNILYWKIRNKFSNKIISNFTAWNNQNWNIFLLLTNKTLSIMFI